MFRSIKEAFEANGYVMLKSLFSREEARMFKEEAKAVMEKSGTNRTGAYDV